MPKNQSFENVPIVTFKLKFDIPLINNLLIPFLNLFSSLTELKTLLYPLLRNVVKWSDAL